MKMLVPQRTAITLEELREEDEEAFLFVCQVAQIFAQKMCRDFPDVRQDGLECVEETILGLLQKGWIRLVEHEDGIGIEVFNPATGHYR